ncbi:hypothetical protein NQ318_005965, partial [Aromia moschata]
MNHGFIIPCRVLCLKTLMDFPINEDYVICESCVNSIYTFLEFKSVCLYTENRMVPFTRTINGMEVDIVEVVYSRENSNGATINNPDDAICRLCSKRDRCVDLNALNKNFAEDIITSCIPEV